MDSQYLDRFRVKCAMDGSNLSNVLYKQWVI